jgi:hypothetical protein
MEQHPTPNQDSAPHKEPKKEEADTQLEREEEYKAVIEPDPLLDEVGKANRKINNPCERRKVVPSKPC